MAEQPSENPKFKLTYFNIRGLAEPIRYLFAYGGIEYEDNRIERPDWAALKPFGMSDKCVGGKSPKCGRGKHVCAADGRSPRCNRAMPFGQMPVLEVDGIRVHQSMAIARYIAKRVGLAGSNDWESLLIDVVADTCTDMRIKIQTAAKECDAALKEKKMEDVKNETIPFYMEKFDAMAKENNGHLALGQLTWADIYFTCITDVLSVFTGINLLENYPNLQAVVNNVNSVDSIKTWIEKRPKTEY